MNKLELLEKLFREKEIITSKELEQYNINNKYITDAVGNNICKKVKSGVYIDIDKSDDYFYFLSKKYEDAVFSLESSLVLNDYVDSVYFKHVMLSSRKIKVDDIKCIKYNTEIGKKKYITEFGNYVYGMDMERTICDMILFKDYIDADIYSKVFKKYMNSQAKDLNKIIKYAKELGESKKICSIVEVFYGW